MAAIGFELDAYLRRIDIGGAVPANAAGVEMLQRAQLAHIPFENFDVLLGREISLDPPRLFDKLVRGQRGGYCFELNALLAGALQAIGCRPLPCLARVIFGRGTPGPRTHQVLIVRAGSRDWLVDAGFGGPGLRAPLPLEVDCEVHQDTDRFRLRRDQQFGFLLQKRIDDQWVDLYMFDLSPALPQDFEMANFFMSRHPQSYFRLHRVASLQRPHGRRTLLDFTLSTQDVGASSVRELPAGAGYLAALSECFGIDLNARYEDLPALGA
jgi:N-hydroxyarylamine O-acetyltransferase